MAAIWQTTAYAHDDVAWKAEREMRFRTVKASSPPQDMTIAAVKAKTALLAATYIPSPGPELDRPPVVWRTSVAPLVVFDAAVAPRMVIVPAGQFTMGSPKLETGRRADEIRRRVRIARPFAVSMFPITFGEYSWFVHATGHKSQRPCSMPVPPPPGAAPTVDWTTPGFAQTARSPAACIAYADAVAYSRWLTKETGQRYRLVTDAEYEYAARAGTTSAYWWGQDFSANCVSINSADRCDAAVFTLPLDQSKPNGFGLFDMVGNVGSWTASCWRGDCADRVVRGGSWATPAKELRSAARQRADAASTSADRGFRVARDL